jgi:hypothetical protein
MKRVWIRLGGFISADNETMEAIMRGDKNALIKAINDNGFEVEGDAYIYDEESGDEVDFDLDAISLVRR